MSLRVGSFRPCPRCGRRYKVHRPRSYVCRACERSYGRAWMKEVVGKWKCARCGKSFPLNRATRYRLQGGTQKNVYCSAACRNAAKRTRYALNPRGPEYCRAPVPGGCDRLRVPSCKGKRFNALCYGHDKRRERGQPLDTPLRWRNPPKRR